jgi:hypothetical protein
MSMALLVLLAADRSPSAAAWQALYECNVPIQFCRGIDLRDGGAIPSRLRGRRSSFQFFLGGHAEVSEHYPELADIKLSSPAVVYYLVYQGDWLQAASAFYAASVLVARFRGVAFEPMASIFRTEKELLEQSKLCEANARKE